MLVRSLRVGYSEGLVVPDPRVLEEVLLVRGDYGLLPMLAGERADRLDILPDRDVQILGRGRVTGRTDMLRNESRLLRHERHSRLSQEGLEIMASSSRDA